MIRAIFFDVDGTLLSHKTKSIPAETKQAFQQLKQKGILVFMSTGRHVLELEELPVHDMQFDGYITLNGQICLDQNKKLLYGTPFPQQLTEVLVDLFNTKQYPLFLVEEDRIYTNFIDEAIQQAQQNVSTSIPHIASYTGKPLYQASAFIPRSLDSKLQAKLPDICHLARWSEDGVDIFTSNGGKVEGMQYFMNQYHIAQDETMAFGDADNDIEMLKFASVGIAMGNASPHVKDIADYVTSDVDHGGIYNALKKYVIL